MPLTDEQYNKAIKRMTDLKDRVRSHSNKLIEICSILDLSLRDENANKSVQNMDPEDVEPALYKFLEIEATIAQAVLDLHTRFLPLKLKSQKEAEKVCKTYEGGSDGNYFEDGNCA